MCTMTSSIFILIQSHQMFVTHDVCGSVYHSIIHTERANKMQECIKILLFLILNEAQHVLGDTPPIIKGLKLH